MRYTSYILILLTLFSIFPNADGQDAVDRIWREVDSIQKAENGLVEKQNLSPWRFNTTVGTSFGFIPGIGSFTSFHASPHVTYKASQRLAFHAGVSGTRAIPFEGSGYDSYSMASLSLFSGYASASYRLTDNLVIHGTGVKGVILTPWAGDKLYTEFHDISVGATYDFGNFSIGATIHKTNNLYPGQQFGSPGGYNLWY